MHNHDTNTPAPVPVVARPAAGAISYPADHPYVQAELRRIVHHNDRLRAERPELFVDLDVVAIVPEPSSTVALFLRAHVAPGSVLVAHHDNPDGTCRLDYEGGLYERSDDRMPTLAERTEYAKRAAGRAATNYPTVARIGCVPRADLAIIGRCNPGEGTVVFHDAMPEAG